MAENKILMEKIAQGRQYRSMQVLECRASENEEEKYIVEGYATTYNEPYDMGEGDNYRVKEQVAPDSFRHCRLDDCIFQYDHVGRVYARTSNKTLRLDPKDKHGLKVWANLGGTEEGRKLYEEIKGGYTNKMSFGFMVDDDEVTESTDTDGKRLYLRTIKSFSRLFDVSAVSIPANDGTAISARNYCDGLIAEVEKRQAEEAEQQARLEEEAKRKAEEEQRLAQEKALKERERLALELSFTL